MKIKTLLTTLCFASVLIGAGSTALPSSASANEPVAQSSEHVATSIAPLDFLQKGTNMDDTYYFSRMQKHTLSFESDGNLVVRQIKGNQAIWKLDSLGVDVSRIDRISFQKDGNVAAYDANGNWVWSMLHKSPDPDATLNITPEGTLQLVSPTRGILWSTK